MISDFGILFKDINTGTQQERGDEKATVPSYAIIIAVVAAVVDVESLVRYGP